MYTQCYSLNVKHADKANDMSSYDKRCQIYGVLYQIYGHQGATVKMWETHGSVLCCNGFVLSFITVTPLLIVCYKSFTKQSKHFQSLWTVKPTCEQC